MYPSTSLDCLWNQHFTAKLCHSQHRRRPLWTPTQSPPTLHVSTECNYTSPGNDGTHVDVKYMSVSAGWLAQERESVFECASRELTLCVSLKYFLTSRSYKGTIWAFCLTHKALWVMPPSPLVRLTINMSCWLRNMFTWSPESNYDWDLVGRSCVNVSVILTIKQLSPFFKKNSKKTISAAGF